MSNRELHTGCSDLQACQLELSFTSEAFRKVSDVSFIVKCLFEATGVPHVSKAGLQSFVGNGLQRQCQISPTWVLIVLVLDYEDVAVPEESRLAGDVFLLQAEASHDVLIQS